MKHSSCTFSNTMPLRRGAVTVEFALVAILFFTLLFGVMEFGRAIYLWNTVQQVTRQAAREATVTDFTDSAAMDKVRQEAIFRKDTGAGKLIAGGEITDAAVRLRYLNVDLDEVDTSMTCPSKNITDCLTNPKGASCIRFVRASICDPANAGECAPILFQPMLLPQFFTGGVAIPSSPVVMPAESLGFRPSSPSCY